MRVFSTFNQKSHNMKDAKGRKTSSKAKHKVRAPRRQYSANEIREMAAKRAKKGPFSREAYQAELRKKSAPLHSQFMKEGERPVIVDPNAAKTKAQALAGAEAPTPSDVDKNDPNDSNTKEKLKDILSGGGFSFNEKESKVLAEILNN